MSLEVMAILLALVLTACGSLSAPKAPRLPAETSERLSAQVHRMKPLLQYTCDGRVPARRQGFDCVREGDAVSITGWSLLYGRLGEWGAIEESIDGTGRPWRNPLRVGGDDDHSFSRDQLLGLLEGTIASGNRKGLFAVMRYVHETGKLCPGDSRCNLTGSTMLLAKLTAGEEVSEAERATDEWVTLLEAKNTPAGYQAHLISRKIMLHAFLGTLTEDYSRAAAILAGRFPKSLFVRTTDAVANRKDFGRIAEDLATCMASWEAPGNAWIGEEIEHGCQKRSYGHEYVALAKFLLSDRESLGNGKGGIIGNRISLANFPAHFSSGGLSHHAGRGRGVSGTQERD